MYAQLSVVVDCENVRKPDGKKLVVLFFGFNTARLESHTYSVCSPAHHGANAYMYVQYYRYAYIRVTEYTTGTERNAKDCLWPCCPSERRLRSRCETDAPASDYIPPQYPSLLHRQAGRVVTHFTRMRSGAKNCCTTRSGAFRPVLYRVRRVLRGVTRHRFPAMYG